MNNNRPNCPALTRGMIGACRVCSLQPGGPSTLCVKMYDAWVKSGSSTPDTKGSALYQISYEELHKTMEELKEDE